MGLLTPRARGSKSHPRARAQRLDVLIGILGFFILMAFIQTVTFELQNKSAGLSAAVLLGLLVALWFAIKAKRRTGI
jgi:uncharacterized membrane protein YhaH (DUF805 family)